MLSRLWTPGGEALAAESRGIDIALRAGGNASAQKMLPLISAPVAAKP